MAISGERKQELAKHDGKPRENSDVQPFSLSFFPEHYGTKQRPLLKVTSTTPPSEGTEERRRATRRNSRERYRKNRRRAAGNFHAGRKTITFATV